MGKNKGNKKKHLPPFVPITYEIMDSKAYKSLRPSAAKALPYFFRKVKIHYNKPERHLADFTFSYQEAKKCGFANGTFHRVICDLIEKGFIDPKDKGGLRGDCKSYNVFRLSERWKKYGSTDFEEKKWESFQPIL